MGGGVGGVRVGVWPPCKQKNTLPLDLGTEVIVHSHLFFVQVVNIVLDFINNSTTSLQNERF